MTDQGFIVFAVVFAIALLAFGVIGLALRRAARSARAAEVSAKHVGSRVDDIEARLGASEHHLANLRQQVGALPTTGDVNALGVRISDIAGEVKGVAITSTANSRSLDRIETYLLSKSEL